MALYKSVYYYCYYYSVLRLEDKSAVHVVVCIIMRLC